MASWREIERLRKDPHAFRTLAAGLLALVSQDRTEWESSFLESIARGSASEYTLRQSEKLFQIRDGLQTIETFRGFSIKTLLTGCYQARLDLSEDDEAWIATLYANSPLFIRRRHIGRLMRCARQFGLVDEEVDA